MHTYVQYKYFVHYIHAYTMQYNKIVCMYVVPCLYQGKEAEKNAKESVSKRKAEEEAAAKEYYEKIEEEERAKKVASATHIHTYTYTLHIQYNVMHGIGTSINLYVVRTYALTDIYVCMWLLYLVSCLSMYTGVITFHFFMYVCMSRR